MSQTERLRRSAAVYGPSMPRPSERALRDQLLRTSALCYERHLLVALDGNLSVRLSDELILCTQAGCHKGMLSDDQLVVQRETTSHHRNEVIV